MPDINHNRKADDSQEKIINEFLMKYYFAPICPSSKLISDHDLQVAGVDIQAATSSGTVNIDVKAQSSRSYINNPRPTFVLELSSYNRNGTGLFQGWFLNPENITDYYTFVWIHDATVNKNGRIVSTSDIHKIEVLTVSKSQLKKFINSKLLGLDLERIANEMRMSGETRRNLTYGLHFSHSPQLPEKPVNIVAKKEILKKFCVEEFGHYFVTPQGISKIY